MGAKISFESRAAEWDSKERPPNLLIDGLRLMALRCWIHTVGGKSDGVSETLNAFRLASEAAQPAGWYDRLLSERSSCQKCGESYHVENLSVCTDCLSKYCPGCANGRAATANGNRGCGCGGELVG